jgi:hypothetical protein
MQSPSYAGSENVTNITNVRIELSDLFHIYFLFGLRYIRVHAGYPHSIIEG